MKPFQRLIEKIRQRLHVLWYGSVCRCAMDDLYCETEREADVKPAKVTEQAVAQ